jgi:predicted nuclease of predicted toxin-antitoxin system
MAEPLRFHLDENVNPSVAEALRQKGIDVTTTVKAGLRGADDLAHIAYAWRERRVIVTHDDDFLRWHSRGVPHAGIAYCHLKRRSVGQIVETLALMHDLLTQEEMIGQVQFL